MRFCSNQLLSSIFATLAFLGVFFLPTSAYTQVIADFSANQVIGCSPLVVQFSDLSSAGPMISRTWSFGVGSPVAGNDSTPTYTYIAPGCYDVELIVSNGIEIDTVLKADFICVQALPDPQFSISQDTACEYELITFTDQTIAADTGIEQLAWYFGDGSDSIAFNQVSHTYSSSGIQTVCLVALDSNGCQNTFCDTVFVLTSPTAFFTTVTPTSSCSSPLNVSFSNQSSSAASYLWDFGDGNTSNQTSPSYTYVNTGIFNVTLIAYNTTGCSDTFLVQDLVQVGLVNGTILFTQDTICVGEKLLYTAVSTSDSAVSWSWPCCGTSSNTDTDSILFSPTQTGFQLVELILYGFGGCTDTIVDSVYVDDIEAYFTQNMNYDCQTPSSVQFTSLSNAGTGISTWAWNFGDGSGSSAVNPLHAYMSEGVFYAELSVMSIGGCLDQYTASLPMVINSLEPTILPDVEKGCFPLTVMFAGGETHGFTDSIQTWTWTFDDPSSGALNTSNLQNPTHIFNDTGVYQVQLSIMDSSGCVHDTSFQIMVGMPVQATFQVPQDTVCAKDPVLFFGYSTDSLIIDEWVWTWTPGGLDSVQSGSHLFSDTGFIDLMFIVGHHGCYDTTLADSVVYISPPVVLINQSVDCSNPLDIMFQLVNKGAHRWYWDFGDGSVDSNIINFTHTYAASGDYNVTVVAYNDSTGCDYTSSITVYVRQIQARYTPNDTITCNGQWVALDASTSIDASLFFFQIEGDTTLYQQMVFSYPFQDSGLFDVELVVEALNGCRDSLTKTFDVKYIKADFAFDTNGLCAPLPVQFWDSSYSDNGIASWAWNFSNGTFDSVQNPIAIYDQAGIFWPSLEVTDSIGCRILYQTSQPITAYGPVFQVTPSDSTPCIGQDVIFNNSSVNMAGGSLGYLWYFGDGDTSTQASPTHLYPDTGWYDVMLIGHDPFYGCIDTLFADQMIHMQSYPIAGFYANPPFIGCFPDCINFLDSSFSTSSPIETWSWNFGDGTTFTSQADTISHCYISLGLFDVSLIVTTQGGCADTLLKPDYISVYGPYASFHLLPDTLCKGDEVMFVVDSLYNVQEFDWDFGDGQILSNVSTDTTYHVYQQVGDFYPKIIYRSDSTCQKVKQDSIYIHRVLAQFNVSDTTLCLEQANFEFYNQSLGADNWTWTWDDGSNQVLGDTLTHQYLQNGTYTVELSIENVATGCKDTAQQLISVQSVSTDGIPGDTSICMGDTVSLLINSSVIDSAWWVSTSIHLSDTTGLSILATANQTGAIYVNISDEQGCTNQDTIWLMVAQPFTTQLIYPEGADTLILVGTSANILVGATPNQPYLYQWIPSNNLTCSDCPNPQASPLSSQNFQVYISDSSHCFYDTLSVFIEVLEEFKASVPTAFSPNGDGENEVIYVKGWGIKELLEFNIYNRWGELVYQNPGDINQGWDGKYKGKIQAQDSYAVTVRAIGYNDQPITYKGFINIIR